jgi:hypothetical protein
MFGKAKKRGGTPRLPLQNFFAFCKEVIDKESIPSARHHKAEISSDRQL